MLKTHLGKIINIGRNNNKKHTYNYEDHESHMIYTVHE